MAEERRGKRRERCSEDGMNRATANSYDVIGDAWVDACGIIMTSEHAGRNDKEK